ncbi:MAG: iron-containing alcohol dehydrogenase family protein [Coriobacteriia bacterium]|nr:iron-containing alcohol dehydrogenase family protein [Coriobacteriia bacterium]
MAVSLNDLVFKLDVGTSKNLASAFSDPSQYSKVLFMTTPTVDKTYGSGVFEQLDNMWEVQKYIFDDNTIEKAHQLAEEIISKGFNLVVALGGGKVLDFCKYASHVAKVHMMSIPTTLSNDSIASPIAVLKMKNDITKSLYCEIPKYLIVDIDILKNSPAHLIRAGIGDTISNYMAIYDWDLAVEKGKDEYNGYAYITSLNALNSIKSCKYDFDDINFIFCLANGLVLSGMSMRINGSSRPVSGSEHLFGHALDVTAKKPPLHGIGVALGTIATLRLAGIDDNFVLDILKKYEVDINPQSLGIELDEFAAAIKLAPTIKPERYTYLNQINTSYDNLIKLYEGLVKDL